MRRTDLDLSPTKRPRCPSCEVRMTTAGVSEGPNALEHRVFECPKCGNAVTSDPLDNAVGWLSGEVGRRSHLRNKGGSTGAEDQVVEGAGSILFIRTARKDRAWRCITSCRNGISPRYGRQVGIGSAPNTYQTAPWGARWSQKTNVRFAPTAVIRRDGMGPQAVKRQNAASQDH
jgi:hypothetical protein